MTRDPSDQSPDPPKGQSSIAPSDTAAASATIPEVPATIDAAPGALQHPTAASEQTEQSASMEVPPVGVEGASGQSAPPEQDRTRQAALVLLSALIHGSVIAALIHQKIFAGDWPDPALAEIPVEYVEEAPEESKPPLKEALEIDAADPVELAELTEAAAKVADDKVAPVLDERPLEISSDEEPMARDRDESSVAVEAENEVNVQPEQIPAAQQPPSDPEEGLGSPGEEYFDVVTASPVDTPSRGMPVPDEPITAPKQFRPATVVPTASRRVRARAAVSASLAGESLAEVAPTSPAKQYSDAVSVLSVDTQSHTPPANHLPEAFEQVHAAAADPVEISDSADRAASLASPDVSVASQPAAASSAPPVDWPPIPRRRPNPLTVMFTSVSITAAERASEIVDSPADQADVSLEADLEIADALLEDDTLEPLITGIVLLDADPHLMTRATAAEGGILQTAVEADRESTRDVAPGVERSSDLSLAPTDPRTIYGEAVRTQMYQYGAIPPERAGDPGLKTAIVIFTVDRNGQATRLRLAKRSGSRKIDERAQEIVRQASPFPAFPEEVRTDRLIVRFIVRLRED